jgi:hypothetical protein
MRNGESQPSRTPIKYWFAISGLFFILGIYAVLTSDLPWLGVVVCALGVFWLFMGWRYGRR